MKVIDLAGELRELRFLAVDTKQHSLFSLSTCLDLGLISTSEHAHLAETDLQPTLDEYKDVFEGVRKLLGEYHLETDAAVRPEQVKPRKIPLSMKDAVQEKLDSLEKLGIVEKVDQPTDWISHLQPVRKPNGAIRLCIDPQHLNTAIKRNHFQMPTVEDVLPEPKDGTMFSLCDAKDGFLQVPLAQKSSFLTTFWGLKNK